MFGTLRSLAARAKAALVLVKGAATLPQPQTPKYTGPPIPVRSSLERALNDRRGRAFVLHANGGRTQRTQGKRDRSLRMRSNRRRAARAAKYAAILFAFALPFGFAPPVQAQTVTVSASSLYDGTTPANGTIVFAPVLANGQAASYRYPGGGQRTVGVYTATVTNGAFTITLPDTSQTSPQNLCFNVVLTGTRNRLGPGYSCVQPAASNSWCSSGACNFDNYIPNEAALVVEQTGPQGPQGPAGPSIAGLSSDGANGITVQGKVSADNGHITTDGSGNLTANGLVSGSISGSVWVDGTHYARTNAGIQAAIAAAPANGTVIIPPGTYTLSATTGQQILIDGTGATHILCLGAGTNLQLQNSAGAIPVIRMKPASQGTYEGWSIEGCQFTTASQGLGTYAIEIDSLINANLGKLRISDNIIGYSAGGPSSVQGFGTGSIYWNNSAGEPNGGIFDSVVENNVVLGEFTLTSIGDSNSWHNNLIAANFPTTDVCNVSFTAGSAKFRFYNNTDEIPVHFGASAYKLQIADNEFEGEFSNLAGSNGAMLDLDGTSANPVVAAAIAGNSFQIGVMTLNFVRLNFASDTVIGGIASPNSFTYHTSGNIDIVTTANSTSTTVGENKTWGTPQAVFVSDSATTGQTIFQDLLWSNGAYVPAIYQDKSGTVYYAARDGGSAMQAADGAIELFSGSTSPSTALMLGGINFTAPSTATIASVGNLFSNGYIETGAAHPTVSGCGTISSQVGGGLAGTFVTSATSCTPVLTALPSTTNGYACMIWDQTHPTAPEGNVSSTASSATFGTFSTTASDVVAFNCGISY